jgi:hypothetical protein
MLDDTDNYIKDNLENIIDGKFNDLLSPDQLKVMLEMSFLYNHITLENDSVIFEYNGVRLKLSGLSELSPLFVKEYVSAMRNDVVFKSALKQFLRDKKINEILE